MLYNGDIVSMTNKRNDFLYHMASIVVEAHPFEIIHYLIGYTNPLLWGCQTKARLNDSATISVCSQLNSELHESFIEFILKVFLGVFLEVGKNYLDYVISILIITQIDKFSIF